MSLFIRLRNVFFPPKVVRRDNGGIIANGPFRVEVPGFGFELFYSEAEHNLTIHLELLVGGSFVVDTSDIRHWDNSSVPFTREQVAIIQNNIFSALDSIDFKYVNSPKRNRQPTG